MRFKNSASSFARNLLMLFSSIALFSVLLFVYISAEKQTDRALDIRFQSFKLADELRQSSDDLTRMVRSYAITGDPIYKQHFQEILDIREGIKPRPVGYENIYWDLVLQDNKRPTQFGKNISLIERMQNAGFTAEEFARLRLAKLYSDELTRIELNAMALVESTSTPTNSNRLAAAEMLNDVTYHRAKFAIMQPISEFTAMVDRRTLDLINDHISKTLYLRVALIIVGAIVIFLLLRTYQSLSGVLGGSVDEVQFSISRLAAGDLSSPINETSHTANSVLGWIAELRASLKEMNAERDQLIAQLESQAHSDYLTNLNNRRHFMKLAYQELGRAKRYAKPLSMLMMDIDHFKQVNDNFGHKTGDLVLQKMANICLQTLRDVDIIGRMGGEEFAVLLPETDRIESAEVAERLRECLAAAKVPLESGLPLTFTVSIGVTSLLSNEDNIDVLISQADQALYEAKNAGRNRVIIWQAA